MQTFLPAADFRYTAKVLDRARLGKQRVETLQIMKSLIDPNHGWKHHPAVKMWKGYGWALLEYQKAICDEWVNNRGYRDTCLDKTLELYNILEESQKNVGVYPPWIGHEEFHRSHRSNLLRKNKKYYSLFWNDIDNLEYIWP